MRTLFRCIYLLYMPITLLLFTTYSLDHVFRYEFKNKRLAYILTFILIFISCIVTDILDVYYGGRNDEIHIYIVAVGMIIQLVIQSILLRGKIWKRTLTAFLTLEIIVNMTDIFNAIQAMLFFYRDWPSDNITWISFLVFSALAYSLAFVFLYFIGRLRKKHDDTPFPLPAMAILALVFYLITSFLSYGDELYTQTFELMIAKVIVLGMILLVVFMYFFVNVTRKERDTLKSLNTINEELIESQTKFFETSAKADSEIRSIRHDMKNNTQVLRLLLENKEYDKMSEYLDGMSDGLTSADVGAHTGDVIADAIITDKKARAASAGAVIDVTGTVTGVEISPVNMCKILGNLLDNAIEALSDEKLKDLPSDQKVIELQFKRTENLFMICVTNPCAECPKIKDGKIVTSKRDAKNHGFGLTNIQTAAEECGGDFSVSCEEKPYGYQFRAEVVI